MRRPGAIGRRLAVPVCDEPLPSTLAGDEAAGAAIAGLPDDELDDATIAYVLAMQSPFALLRDGISQLAGLMVLAAAGARNDAAQSIVSRVTEDQACARDLICAAANRLPARAMHHHRHLSQALEAFGHALAAAQEVAPRANTAAVDAVMLPLRRSYRELQWAAGALPGFEIVALSQGCCAMHAGTGAGLRAIQPTRRRGRKGPDEPLFDLGT